MVTVMNSDGKPTQVPASSLNMSGALSGGVAGLSPSSSVAAGIYLKIELGLSIVYLFCVGHMIRYYMHIFD